MDIEIKITCPYCKQDYFINESQLQLGQQAECAVCRRTFVIGEKCININSSIIKNKDKISTNTKENNQHDKTSENDFNRQYEQLLQHHDLTKVKKKRIWYILITFFVIFTIPLFVYFMLKNKCTKAELDIVADVQKAIGLSIGEKLNIENDTIPHVKNAKFLFDNYPYERQYYRVKNYKPGSFMNFQYCAVEIIPSSDIICGFEFISYHSSFYSFQRKLDESKNDIIDAVKLKYHVELDNMYLKDHSASRFFGKKYRAIISYNTTNSVGTYHTSNGDRLGEMDFERLSYHVSDIKLDEMRRKEEEIMKNEEKLEELKTKGVLKKNN